MRTAASILINRRIPGARMTIKAVTAAIRLRRSILTQWSEIGLDNWSEWHTRYTLIDPIVRALGWDTSSPTECRVEWPRPSGQRKVDYALFGNADLDDIVAGNIAPTIIIESKRAKTELTVQHVDGQLSRYANCRPRMYRGVAVLTNGRHWLLYDMSKRVRFGRKLSAIVDITKGKRQDVAKELHYWLNRERWL